MTVTTAALLRLSTMHVCEAQHLLQPCSGMFLGCKYLFKLCAALSGREGKRHCSVRVHFLVHPAAVYLPHTHDRVCQLIMVFLHFRLPGASMKHHLQTTVLTVGNCPVRLQGSSCTGQIGCKYIQKLAVGAEICTVQGHRYISMFIYELDYEFSRYALSSKYMCMN